MTFYDTPHPLAAENAMLKRLLRDLLGLLPNSSATLQPVVMTRAVLGMQPPAQTPTEEPGARIARLREQHEQDDCA